MDEEPPVFLAYQPYRGPASIPHVPGEFFGAFFLALNVSLAPGGALGGRRAPRDPVAGPLLAPVSPTAARPAPAFHPQTSLLCHMFPGKVFGSEMRARRHE
jgi:hypothetical protein